MKAEHRKELETNTLADRMGRAVQGVQRQSRRTVLFIVIGTVVACLALFIVYNYFRVRRMEASQHWEMLEDGSKRYIENLARGASDTNAGKAARFQIAWHVFWERGVKFIGNNPQGALQALEAAAADYNQLANDCKGDPVWEPAARYALAVIEETKAVQNRDRLQTAKRMFEEVARDHEKSAYGKLAKDWLKNYEDAGAQQNLAAFYQEMQASLRVPEAAPPRLKGLGKGVELDIKPGK
jgi:hypothetical protein